MSEKSGMVDAACFGTGCMDDLCRGSGTCLVKGWPLSERCPSCGDTFNRALGEDCSCEWDDAEPEDWSA